MENTDLQALQDEVRIAAAPLQLVRGEMGRIVAGQEKLVERLMVALISVLIVIYLKIVNQKEK